MNFKQTMLRYWLAMSASAFDAATHVCAAFLGVAGAHAASETIPTLNLRQLAAVFAIAFGRALLAYLNAHPVEDLLGRKAGDGDPSTDAMRSSTSSSLTTSLASPDSNGDGHQSAAASRPPAAICNPQTAP